MGGWLLFHGGTSQESSAITSPIPHYVARLPHPFVIEVAGRDAAQVVNNLSTNDLARLPVDSHQETFITDVRGWVVAHAVVLKQADRVWLIGSHESPGRLCDHIDRYIIREQASINDHSTTHELLAVGNGLAPSLSSESQLHAAGTTAAEQWIVPVPLVLQCAAPILGGDSRLCCLAGEQFDLAISQLQSLGARLCSDQQFHWLRISSFWPLHPADIADKTIPQELDRDARAISFTKGCYLGQETIARLDARGQLQKKLCLFELTTDDATRQFQSGDKLLAADKEVGHITSVAQHESATSWRGLALLRRGNFAAGTRLTCHGQPAQVLPTP